MIWLITALAFGILSGVVTGLTPGLHTNTLAIMVVSSSALLLKVFTPLEVATFLVAMVVVHSFVDFIPSIFLGAPEDVTVLSILPGHELLLKGKGLRAVKLTVVGGVGTFLLSLIFILPLFLALKKSYAYMSIIIAPILLCLSVIFIAGERSPKKVFWATLIFLLAGSLGLVVLNRIPIKQPMFPLLSGLFGVSTLFLSLFGKQKLPQQNIREKVCAFSKTRIFDYVKAAISSLFVSVLPAVGASQAAVISRAFTKFKDKEEFLVVLGGINTAAAIFTLTTLFILGKARTGVIAALKEVIKLNTQTYLALIIVCFISMVAGASLTIKISKLAAKNISKINYKKISVGVICLIFTLVIIFSGLIGLWVLLVATSIGLLAPLIGVKRIHLMACLIMPVILYYI